MSVESTGGISAKIADIIQEEVSRLNAWGTDKKTERAVCERAASRIMAYIKKSLGTGAQAKAGEEKSNESAKRMEPRSKNFVMPFGKYKGKTLGQIVEANPGYVLWLEDNNVLKIEESLLNLAAQNEELKTADVVRFLSPPLND
jgi:uncharacterized protein (DUF3820 family)